MLLFSKKRISSLILSLFLLAGGIFYFTQTSQGATRTWTGAVDNNWSNASNWSGGKPGSGDVAYFDNTCTRCDVTINENVNVAGINMASNYTGTITQSGSYTITVGVSGWVQAGGTFAGGSASITTQTFALSGGTFTSTSGTLDVRPPFFQGGTMIIFTKSGGTFTHNNGTVRVSPTGDWTTPYFNINVTSPLSLYTFMTSTASSDTRAYIILNGTITVENHFIHKSGQLAMGQIDLLKDISILCAGGVDGCAIGATAAAGASGTGRPTRVRMYGSENATYTYNTGAVGPHVEIDKDEGVTVTPASGITDLILSRFTLTQGIFTAPTGTLSIAENLGWCGAGSGETIFTVSGGTFNHSNGTLYINTGGICAPHYYNISVTGSLVLYNGTFKHNTSSNGVLTLSGTLSLLNAFSHTGGSLNGGTITIQGHVTIGVDAGGGTTPLGLVGSNNQTYTDQGGDEPNGDITVSKTGGVVTLASNADWNATNQDLTITAGTLIQGTSYNVATNSVSISSGAKWYNSGTGDVILGGNVTNNGTIIFAGGSTGCGGTDDIAITSTGAQRTWSGTGTTTMADVSVSNQGGTQAVALYSATNGGGNGANWTFNVVCPPVYWTGDVGDGSWEDDRNWLSWEPGASDVANFDATYCGSNCSATTNKNVDVAGINMASTYTGTITQSGSYTITVGSSGWIQAGGTFAGGSGDITTSTFTQSGGTFTSTGGTLTINSTTIGNVTIFTYTAGTFNPNGGTLKFYSWYSSSSCTHTINLNGSTLSLNNLIYSGGDYYGNRYLTYSLSGTFDVAGDLTLEADTAGNSNARIIANSGTIQVQGDVTVKAGIVGGTTVVTFNGSGDQEYTWTGGLAPYFAINKSTGSVGPASGTTNLTVFGFTMTQGTFTAPSGTLTINSTTIGNVTIFTYTAGTFNPNGGTLKFYSWYSSSSCTHTINLNGSTLSLNNLIYSGGDYYGDRYLTYSLSGTFDVAGDLTLEADTAGNSNARIIANSGTIQVQGDVTVKAGIVGGTTLLQFTGSQNQTYTDQGGNEPDGDITINKTSGAVTLASNADWNATNQDLTITSGKLSSKGTYNIATNALTIGTAGEFIMAGTGDLTLGGTLTNSGKLFMASNGSCGGADNILIRSSVNGTQRSWNGTGRFTLQDLDVKDMAGSASLTLYSSTNTGNNGANWTFSGASCPVPPPIATIGDGFMNVGQGMVVFPGF